MKAILTLLTPLIFSFSSARAATINIVDLVSGQPVSASADYLFTTNTLTITLRNLTANPTSVAQAVSGIDFTVGGGLSGTLSSATGDLVNVGRLGVVTSLGNASIDWVQPGAGFFTTALGTSGPDNTLLGLPDATGVYSNANGSIANNGPHNPFTRYQAILTYSIPGATSTSQLSSFAFFFNTDSQRRDVPTGAVPEPGTVSLVGIAAASLFVIRRRQQRTTA